MDRKDPAYRQRDPDSQTSKALKSGFTLLELLVALSILSTLLLISLPSLNGLKNTCLLESTAKSIAGDLHFIQQSAMTSLFPHQIVFSENYYLVQRYNLLGWSLQTLRQETLAGSISLKNPKTILFATSGFPYPGKFGTLTLEDRAGNHKKIVVSSSGRIRIE